METLPEREEIPPLSELPKTSQREEWIRRRDELQRQYNEQGIAIQRAKEHHLRLEGAIAILQDLIAGQQPESPNG